MKLFILEIQKSYIYICTKEAEIILAVENDAFYDHAKSQLKRIYFPSYAKMTYLGEL